MSNVTLLDCTLRDGGYYNAWDFSLSTINEYLSAMSDAGIDVVEVGFRFASNHGFKGPCAYSTDGFLNTLSVPEGLALAVMVNASDLLGKKGLEGSLADLFPEDATESVVSLVRIASHIGEFEKVLPATEWLSKRGYKVGVNIMQVSDRSRSEVSALAFAATRFPIDVLYFADSMGSLSPEDTCRIIEWLREGWSGELGIHTHDNKGMALQNTLAAYRKGVTWLDATVTGMGRGPGNARTEELVVEMESVEDRQVKLLPMLSLIDRYFKPMKLEYGWGTNVYYYLSGKFGIHPTYIQEMLNDPRYEAEDVFAVIEYLRKVGGSKYSVDTLDGARNFFTGIPGGSWRPVDHFRGKDVLILGAGEGVASHKTALEMYIKKYGPLVIALNTQSALDSELIHFRAACHPVRIMADAETYVNLPQPLITPLSMLPDDLRDKLTSAKVHDFGLSLNSGGFTFDEVRCSTPSLLVLAYALAIGGTGQAKRILLAGFDGYSEGDPRNVEVDSVFAAMQRVDASPEILSLTPTRFEHVQHKSVYGY